MGQLDCKWWISGWRCVALGVRLTMADGWDGMGWDGMGWDRMG